MGGFSSGYVYLHFFSSTIHRIVLLPSAIQFCFSAVCDSWANCALNILGYAFAAQAAHGHCETNRFIRFGENFGGSLYRVDPSHGHCI
jgi:hypothetical protein